MSLGAAYARLRDHTFVVVSDRSALFRGLKDILTPDELTDFEASLRRHGTAVTAPEGLGR